MSVSGVPDPLGMIRYAKFVVVETPFAIREALPNCKSIEEVHLTGIPSSPPAGKSRIQNIFWDPSTRELVFTIEE